jgi:hypothetical protein
MWMFSAALKFLYTKGTRHTDMANTGGAVLKLFVENLPKKKKKNGSHTIKPEGSGRVSCKKRRKQKTSEATTLPKAARIKSYQFISRYSKDIACVPSASQYK